MIALLLPFISLCGLFGNGFAAFVYSRPAMRTSTNLYLCALGCSDNGLSIIYNMLSPYVYPVGMIAQTCSVYFTLMLLLTVSHTQVSRLVCLPDRFRQWFNHPWTIKGLLSFVILFSILYNLPHCFEGILIECWHTHFNHWAVEVCPAPFRFHPTYVLVYYKYFYSIFLAVGPLVVLIVLNTCIILFTMVFKKVEGESGDNVALILVVVLFICCNTVALLINIYEEHLSKLLEARINYMFRRNFKHSVCGRCMSHHHSVLVKTMGEAPNTALIRTSIHEAGSGEYPACAALQFARTESTDSLGPSLRAAANKEVLI
ncbi:G-PROTEIN-RECEP-F1-2 domain-containing protein [Aphelenchoides fujianensis]|nr:G-PROTEIN-RECEP-F1-2 domain-containing protein [Aphelenchoides fujianensis]